MPQSDPSIDKALQFLRAYFEGEYGFYQRGLSGAAEGSMDMDAMRKAIAHMRANVVMSKGAPAGVEWVPGSNGVSPSEKVPRFSVPAVAAAALENLTPRRLFVADKHEHPILGDVVVVWTDTLVETFRGAPRWAYAVADVDGPKIVSMTSACLQCFLTGVDGGHGTEADPGPADGPKCARCDGRGALHEWGIDLSALGPSVSRWRGDDTDHWMYRAFLDASS